MKTFPYVKLLALLAAFLLLSVLQVAAKTIDPDTVPGLMRQLGDQSSPDTRAQATAKLSRRLTLPTIKALIAEMQANKGNMREECLSLLRWSKDPHLVDLLLPLLTDKDTSLRNSVLELLSRQKDPRLIPVFQPLLAEKQNNLAVSFFLQYIPPAVDKLLPLLKTAKGVDLPQLIRKLGHTHDARVLPELVRLAQDTDQYIRFSACAGIVRIRQRWHCVTLHFVASRQ